MRLINLSTDQLTLTADVQRLLRDLGVQLSTVMIEKVDLYSMEIILILYEDSYL